MSQTSIHVFLNKVMLLISHPFMWQLDFDLSNTYPQFFAAFHIIFAELWHVAFLPSTSMKGWKIGTPQVTLFPLNAASAFFSWKTYLGA